MQDEVKKEQTLEEGLAQLDVIARTLESRDISLEDSFEAYKKGMELLKDCSSKIDRIEKKMLLIRENGEYEEFE